MIPINKTLIDNLVQEARNLTRRRKILTFHTEANDTLQRMLQALEPETYVQPHKHEDPDKREVFILLKGKAAVVEFTDQGEIQDHIILDSSTGNFGTEISPRTWHSLLCLEPGTVLYEVKDGPYDQKDDKNFASWAPTEGDPAAPAFNEEIKRKLGIDL